MASPNATSAYDHLLKILLIGDSSSNKRTLLKTYIGDLDISDTTTLGRVAYIVVSTDPPFAYQLLIILQGWTTS